MGSSNRFVALFAILGCGGGVVAACGSSDTSSGAVDSGVGVTDATTPNEAAAPGAGMDGAGVLGEGGGDAGGGDAGSANGEGGGIVDSGCPAVGVSIATVDAGALWGCLQSTCMSELTACAADCVCNDAMLGALLCAASAVGQTAAVTCFQNAVQQNLANLSVFAVGNCLQSNALACLATSGGTDASADASAAEGGGTDGGQEGGLEAGSDGSSRDGSDGSTTSDGSSDASSDVGSGDSPSGD